MKQSDIDLAITYHLFDGNNLRLLSTNDLFEACEAIRGLSPGARIVRNDGKTLAYTAGEDRSKARHGFPWEQSQPHGRRVKPSPKSSPKTPAASP
jgi:hypothetical protein